MLKQQHQDKQRVEAVEEQVQQEHKEQVLCHHQMDLLLEDQEEQDQQIVFQDHQ
jgi:hypothetical protein